MYKYIKIVALTRFRNKEFITSMFQAGASAYLTKSVTKDELVDAIKEVYNGAVILHRSVAESLEQILAAASAPNSESFCNDGLSLRESEVIALISQGMSNKDIAKALYLSDRTIQNHVASIFRKLRVHDRTAAALYVIQKTAEKNALKDGPPLLVDFANEKIKG
jgi:DNA-binding NarL/FixJ family response regulator